MPHLFKPITGFLAALTIVSIVPSLAFSQQNSYSDQVVKKAESLMLHEERTWEVLLHYTRTFSGGHESRIDDPRFFLAPDGRTNRGAELEATLRSFFIPPAKDGEHAACRFPARYEWLRTKLDIDASQIPEFRCSERDKSLGAVDADSAVLVFPVGHINSPASMFGHTLIRIDGGTRSNLISYAANYSADTTDTNGFIYAWKGLTGMYKGYYSMMPYYIKVNEYNDLEHRDMWEYKLKLSPVEVGGMLNHIWELQNVHSAYYFLDENCSYNLLFLIEAARPELHLTDKTGIFVLPTQTVQIITASGIVESINYRPSQGAKITKIVSLLDSGEQKLAHGLAFLSIKPESIGTGSLSDIKKMKILDLAASYARFRFARKELGKEVYTKLYLGILKERSRLGTYPADPHEIDTPSTPESGHETSKIGIGTGARRGKAFTELNLRPKFHDLLDPDRGYLPGAQIKFLDTVLRCDIPSGDIQLKTLHILDILSIAPRDMFFKPVSWKVNTGFDSEPMRNGKDYLIYRLNTGGGFSYTSPFGGILYALAEIDANAGSGIRGRVTIGPGLTVGGIERITDWWKIHLNARGVWYKLGDDRYSLKASVGQNFRLSRNNSLSMDYSEEYVNQHRISETSVLWNYYF